MSDAETLAECIDTSGTPTELVCAVDNPERDYVMLRYTDRPNIYRSETEALLEHGYMISGLTPGTVHQGSDHDGASDDDVCVFVSPVTTTEDTVEVTQVRVDFDR